MLILKMKIWQKVDFTECMNIFQINVFILLFFEYLFLNTNMKIRLLEKNF